MFHKFYGDETRWFIGVVVDNNDPLNLGRVKVRIHGIHSDNKEEIPDWALPWAQVLIPVTEEGTTGYGYNPYIIPTAQVFGIFLDGKSSQLPLILGSIPKIEQGYESSQTDEDLEGATLEEKAFLYLISDDQHAYTPIQAAGILGNLIHESGLNPRQVSKVPGEDSYGIAQWNPAVGRKQELFEWCKLNKLDPSSLIGQLKFIKYDLDKNSDQYRIDKTLGDLQNATTIETACKIFEKRYERPKAGSTQARLDEAIKIYERLAV